MEWGSHPNSQAYSNVVCLPIASAENWLDGPQLEGQGQGSSESFSQYIFAINVTRSPNGPEKVRVIASRIDDMPKGFYDTALRIQCLGKSKERRVWAPHRRSSLADERFLTAL